jgi:hypothetical protein
MGQLSAKGGAWSRREAWGGDVALRKKGGGGTRGS